MHFRDRESTEALCERFLQDGCLMASTVFVFMFHDPKRWMHFTPSEAINSQKALDETRSPR